MPLEIGAPLPAGGRLYGMAKELGRAVARTALPLEHAYASCIVATLSAERAGDLGPYAARDIVAYQRWLIQAAASAVSNKRELCAHQIRRTVAPMIARRKPRNMLLAEAHGVNGVQGFPLLEGEVNDLVRTEVWYALPPAPRGGSHGR
jgi:hypothetical protein